MEIVQVAKHSCKVGLLNPRVYGDGAIVRCLTCGSLWEANIYSYYDWWKKVGFLRTRLLNRKEKRYGKHGRPS